MKKKTLSRFLATFFTAAFCLSSLSGCGSQPAGKSSEGSGSVKDVVVQDSPEGEASESGQESGESSADIDDLYIVDMLGGSKERLSTDSTVGRAFAEKTGVALHYITFSGDIQEKQAMLLAGGDYCELQSMQHNDIVKKYIEADALINLDDYKDLLPHFYERFKDQIPYWRAIAPDGGLYKWEESVPRNDPATSLASLYGIVVRTDVLEHYGWPQLVTASDYIDFLEKAVQDFPTTPDGQETIGLTLPMAEPWGAQGLIPIAAEYGDTYANVGNDYYIYNVKTKQFEDYLLTDDTKESFRFFNTLYQKGLFDVECFTDTCDITSQKMASGRAIAEYYCDWMNGDAYKELSAAGHPEMAYIALPFQLDSQKGQKFVTRSETVHPYDSFGITKNCKDPEKLIKAIDFACSDEGQLLLQSGLEGVHYTVEDGKRVPTDLRIQCTKDDEVASKEGLQDSIYRAYDGLPYAFVIAPDGQPFNLANEQEYVDQFALNDREKEAFAALGWKNSRSWWAENADFVDGGLIFNCALDTTSDLGKVGQKMVDVRVKYTGNLIMAEDFDAAWDEMIAEYDKLDHQAVIDAMNEKLADLSSALENYR